MASSNKLGTLVKEARTKANLSQEKLASKITGISAGDISKIERGELVPTQDVLKQIAKITGVTQSSLIEASKSASSSAKKTSTTAKTGTAKKTSGTAKTSTAKKTSSSSSSSGTSVKVTAAEKKLLEAYRKADSKTRKAAMKVLSGESNSILDTILGAGASASLGDTASSITENLVGGLVNSLLGNLGK